MPTAHISCIFTLKIYFDMILFWHLIYEYQNHNKETNQGQLYVLAWEDLTTALNKTKHQSNWLANINQQPKIFSPNNELPVFTASKLFHKILIYLLNEMIAFVWKTMSNSLCKVNIDIRITYLTTVIFRLLIPEVTSSSRKIF